MIWLVVSGPPRARRAPPRPGCGSQRQCRRARAQDQARRINDFVFFSSDAPQIVDVIPYRSKTASISIAAWQLIERVDIQRSAALERGRSRASYPREPHHQHGVFHVLRLKPGRWSMISPSRKFRLGETRTCDLIGMPRLENLASRDQAAEFLANCSMRMGLGARFSPLRSGFSSSRKTLIRYSCPVRDRKSRPLLFSFGMIGQQCIHYALLRIQPPPLRRD